jgi:DNA polymerase-1
MDLTAIGNVAAKASGNLNRKVHASRVLQFDADFACYEVADLEVPAANNMKNLLDLLNMKRVTAGAGKINCFITLGYKSGRDTMATVKPYQENRDPDAPIKVRVRELRHLLANYESDHIKVIVGHFFEADDLMCREQEKMIAEGRVKDSILMSGDKDLWMVQGYHADPKTGRQWLVDGFGKTEYREVGNVKPKLVGEGTSWFWHQLIMGDKADNIPGLEKISNATLDRYQPLKSGKPRKVGSGACGEAKAVAILDGVTSDTEAAQKVFQAYYEYYGVHAKERLVEQGYLLWMQRNTNLWDVIDFFRESGIKIEPTSKQWAISEEFKLLSNGRL